jgi:hypothetical protein
MAKNPTITVVGSAATGTSPPRKLGQHGLNLWNAVMAEYEIADTGGLEILAQVCAATDRAEELKALLDVDGAVIRTKAGPREHPGLKAELACRSFICRNLQRLGLNVEAIKPIGRPSGWSPPT